MTEEKLRPDVPESPSRQDQVAHDVDMKGEVVSVSSTDEGPEPVKLELEEATQACATIEGHGDQAGRPHGEPDVAQESNPFAAMLESAAKEGFPSRGHRLASRFSRSPEAALSEEFKNLRKAGNGAK